jgi:hypothetical protein
VVDYSPIKRENSVTDKNTNKNTDPMAETVILDHGTARANFDASFDDLIRSYGTENGHDNIFRGHSVGNRQFLNEDTNVHVGSEYTKKDYYYFRRSEDLKKSPKGVIAMCMDACDNVGILRNTIDLMGDFAAKGITIVHKNKRQQKFLRQWFRMVNGGHVTERFLNTLYKSGNVIIEQFNGKIKEETEETWKSIGFIDAPIKKREIPRQYVIHNPLAVEKRRGALVTDRPEFFINTSKLDGVANMFTGMKSTTQRMNGAGLVQLDSSRVFDYYYKKDDWDTWAKPMVYSIMNEIMILDKVQLADISALDGAISNIRLWTLGSFEHDIFPSPSGINKLRRILANRNGGGVIDLVWGPELSFKESNTEVHKFLGKEKYEAILTLIYAGLGIPPTMTGGSGASGATNNMVSIKTLVERLQYGRDMVSDFWTGQLNQVSKAMGFTGVAKIVFTSDALADEAAQKSLLLDLIDRDIISSESVHERFGFDSEIESTKVNRESRGRGKSAPYKAGPYHNAQPDHELKKIALNSGAYAPSEVGITLDEKVGEAPSDKQAELANRQIEIDKPKGDPGRPYNAKDGKKRTRTVKPRTMGVVERLGWVKAYDRMTESVNPAFLASVGKKNLRQLTKDEYSQMENIKFHCLAHVGQDFKVEDIAGGLAKGDNPKLFDAKALVVDFVEYTGKMPSVDETREIYITVLTGQE